ncbi:MAG: group 1 truncated hemoglobin [Idiomarina sp.]
MMFKTRLLAAMLLLGLAGSVQADDSLYQQLGGKQGISNVMAEMLYELAGDDRIADQFADTDIDRLHQMLTEQVCEISGGPCTYTGEDMVKIHTGLNITNADFNALVENLIIAMEREDVPTTAQNRLLSLLADMHNEVVGL